MMRSYQVFYSVCTGRHEYRNNIFVRAENDEDASAKCRETVMTRSGKYALHPEPVMIVPEDCVL